jgi:transposase-like protein
MGARGRHSLDRSASSESRLTYTEFLRRFPDSDACLEWLRQKRWPDGIYCPSARCLRVRNHHRVNGRQAYECDVCRHQVYPTKGTIFQKSSTNLQLWYYAIFLMASTRCGISAKQLERELGVTYPTAWRMFREIRSLLSEPDIRLAGEVEVDKTYVGGKPRSREIRAMAQTGLGPMQAGQAAARAKKTTVFGTVERGGQVIAHVVPAEYQAPALHHIETRILPASMVYSDEAPAYMPLPSKGYQHRRIQHSAKVYVEGTTHTNTIEGFWSLVKRGIDGVHHSVSAKHLQSYLDEYCFRYSHRLDATSMFDAMLDRLAAGTSAAQSPA